LTYKQAGPPIDDFHGTRPVCWCFCDSARTEISNLSFDADAGAQAAIAI